MLLECPTRCFRDRPNIFRYSPRDHNRSRHKRRRWGCRSRLVDLSRTCRHISRRQERSFRCSRELHPLYIRIHILRSCRYHKSILRMKSQCKFRILRATLVYRYHICRPATRRKEHSCRCSPTSPQLDIHRFRHHDHLQQMKFRCTQTQRNRSSEGTGNVLLESLCESPSLPRP
jgi:hypothetical protein